MVYPHDLAIGGSQINAIEIAGAVRDLGHEVIVVGEPGALTARVVAEGMEFVALPPPRLRPSPSTVRRLRELVQERRIDVAHGYEWPPAIHLSLATTGTNAAVTATVMSMSVAPFIPRSVPLVVGTEQIASVERERGRGDVMVIEPPIDVHENDPGRPYDITEFRRWANVDDDALLVVSVGRLARELKLEGLVTAVETVPTLGRKIQLVIVGDGPAREALERAAARANAIHQRRAVLVPGELRDPRAAYACADIVLAMGGSALRALSFGKPVVVQGEGGFWQTLTPQSLDDFLWHGWYGSGEGQWAGGGNLKRMLRPLIDDARLRETLGAFGRTEVAPRFSLEAAARRQVALYERVLASPHPGVIAAPEVARASLSFITHAAQRKWRRRVMGARDDFNSAPLTARGVGAPQRDRPAAVMAQGGTP